MEKFDYTLFYILLGSKFAQFTSRQIVQCQCPNKRSNILKPVSDVPHDLICNEQPFSDVPHDLICNGQVLALKERGHPDNVGLFSKFHQKGNAVVVYGATSDRINTNLWNPDSFSKHFGGFGDTDKQI